MKRVDLNDSSEDSSDEDFKELNDLHDEIKQVVNTTNLMHKCDKIEIDLGKLMVKMLEREERLNELERKYDLLIKK